MFGLVAETKIEKNELICRGSGWRLHNNLPIPDVAVRSALDKNFVKQTTRLFSVAQIHPTKKDENSRIKIIMNANSPIVLFNDYHNFAAAPNASITQEVYTAEDGSVHPNMLMSVHADDVIEAGTHVLVDYGQTFHCEDPDFSSGDDMDDKGAAVIRRSCDPESHKSAVVVSRIPESIAIEADDKEDTQDEEETKEEEENEEEEEEEDEEEETLEEHDGEDEEEVVEVVKEVEVLEVDEQDPEYVEKPKKAKKRKKPESTTKTKLQRIPKKKKPQDNAPKAYSAYIIFCSENRPKLSKDIDSKNMLVELGRRWKLLSTADKKPYEDKALVSRKERAAFISHAKLVSHTHT